MRKSNSGFIQGSVSGGVVRFGVGLDLPEGSDVLVLPLDWLRESLSIPASKARASRQGSVTKKKHQFASEDLAGSYAGDGVSATNDVVRQRLRAKARS